MSYEEPELVAIDPVGCGCTECLIGEYKPIDQATEDDMRRLFAGELRDNASVHWSISQTSSYEEDGFDIYGGSHSFHVDTLALPIQVELYTIEVGREVFEKITDGGGYPSALGKDA